MRVLTIIPTYDEKLSLPTTLSRLRATVPDADVLIVDDNSPDGTGVMADGYAAEDAQVHVLHRRGKEGLGAAYRAGFAWGLERDYEVLVEMDADGSHRPEDLPRLLAAVEGGADLAVGSRWVPGGSVVNWPLQRKVISRGGSFYVRTMLGLPYRDATAGFKAFRASTLRRIDFASVQSAGYVFQVDLLWRTHLAGLRVVEVPITFVERVAGDSKMSGAIVAEAMQRVTVWGLTARARVFKNIATSVKR